mmetsp:Transcript_118551/g.342800  ORF Transcript_118551/g.342800 Transcript_118551/m.342800 type:complete len:233 (+) Transcript_118551:258-956(+)
MPPVDASVEHGVEDDRVLADSHCRPVQNGQRLPRGANAIRPARGVHHDGHDVGVRWQPTGVHVFQDRPDLIEVQGFRGATQQATEGRRIGHTTASLHLAHHLLDLGHISDDAESLDHRVEGDLIPLDAAPRHLVEELAGHGHVLVRGARVEDDVVRHAIDHMRLLFLKLPESGDRFGQVAILTRPTNRPEVRLDTASALGLLQELLGHGRAASLDRELHQVAVRHSVELDAC